MKTRFIFNTTNNNNSKFIINTKDNKQIEITEKDLKVLEILKKHLHIRNGTWSDIITCNIDSLTNENYEILEEWLNEK